MAEAAWDARAIPDLTGKTALVTGANTGIGKEAARVLASKGAHVILAVRDVAKGERAAEDMRGGGKVSVRQLDLASLKSVRAFAEAFRAAEPRLDILIANAGLMMPPYGKTEDGFELQFGTNHLGHFALVGLLKPVLDATPGARVVVVSSAAHKTGKVDFADLNWEKRKYVPVGAYSASKLMNLLFVNELARRVAADGKSILVTAAHPGWTNTDLQRHSKFFAFLNVFFSQGVEMGALPTLRAAIDPAAQPGDYYGPSGGGEMKGPPVKVPMTAAARDPESAKKLWAVSEQLTGVAY
jgi:NAD(P)-dependent dehydrogenase (short-subunit alcohol dehydrogenase family)